MASFDQRGQQVETQYNAGRDIILHEPAAVRLSPQERENRRRMLARVRGEVEGWLWGSLEGAALATLGLEARPDAVPDRWGLIVQERGRATSEPVSTQAIAELFDRADGELLILGEPGSGKTTTLLELARVLLGRAEHDDALSMPVILQLASWGAERRSIADWLADELTLRYGVSQKLARSWVTEDRILPLLDGLDEVAAEHRATCVAAINAYREGRQHTLASVVVCCRVAEYEALPQLQLRGAALIRPLQQDQIDTYLAAGGDWLAGLRAAHRADAELRALATSPLWLNLMVLTYQDAPAETLPTRGTAEQRRAQLLDAYVDRMFARRAADRRYSREQTLQWLAWLARELSQKSQTVFYLDRLQPDWLTTARARREYALVDRLGWGLIAWLVGLQLTWVPGFGDTIASTFALGLALISGVFGASSVGLAVAQRILDAGKGLLIGLVVALLVGLTRRLNPWQSLITGLMTSWLPLIVASWLTGGPSFGSRSVAIVETVRWSAPRALRAGLVYGSTVGPAVGFFLWFGTGLLPLNLDGDAAPFPRWLMRLLFGLGAALTFGLLIGLVVGTFGGLTGGEVESKTVPNQGIHRSARQALFLGLLATTTCGLALILALPLAALLTRGLMLITEIQFAAVLGMEVVPESELLLEFSQGVKEIVEHSITDSSGVIIGLGVGLGLGLAFGLAFGGYACLSHLALRLVLWRYGAMPLRYVRFLDYATERIFLRRVGGGYLFVHRLVQEHFAALEPSRAVDERRGSTATASR